MLGEELVDGRHTEEVGDLPGGEISQHQVGVEFPQVDHRGTETQAGRGVQVETAGMEGGQHVDGAGVLGEADRIADVDGVVEEHPVGDDRSLGMPGGARRVHDRPGIVVGGGHRRSRRRVDRGERLLVGIAEQQPHRDVQLVDSPGELLFIDEHPGG